MSYHHITSHQGTVIENAKQLPEWITELNDATMLRLHLYSKRKSNYCSNQEIEGLAYPSYERQAALFCLLINLLMKSVYTFSLVTSKICLDFQGNGEGLAFG